MNDTNTSSATLTIDESLQQLMAETDHFIREIEAARNALQTQVQQVGKAVSDAEEETARALAELDKINTECESTLDAFLQDALADVELTEQDFAAVSAEASA